MEGLDTKKDLNCHVCGKLKENRYFALCKDCTPFLYKKQGLPHQKARKRKKWVENREKVLKKVGNKCQWCDSKKAPFSIHHPNSIDARDYDRIWYIILFDLIEKLPKDATLVELYKLKVASEQKKTLKRNLKNQKQKARSSMIKVCPKCKGSNYSERSTLKPRYKCSSCKKEFDDFKIRPPKNLSHSIEKLETKLKTQNYSSTIISPSKMIGSLIPYVYDEVLKAYDKNVKHLVSDYEEMKDVQVLCKKCHRIAGLGLIICEKCKTHYRKPQYETCFSCSGKNIELKRTEVFFEEDWEDWDF